MIVQEVGGIGGRNESKDTKKTTDNKSKDIKPKGAGMVGKVGSLAKGLAGGLGGVLGGLALGAASDYAKEKGMEKTGAGLDVGSSALTGAGTGAMIGSIVPVVGTAIGGVLGGLAGGAYGLYKNRGTLFGGKDKEIEKTPRYGSTEEAMAAEQAANKAAAQADNKAAEQAANKAAAQAAAQAAAIPAALAGGVYGLYKSFGTLLGGKGNEIAKPKAVGEATAAEQAANKATEQSANKATLAAEPPVTNDSQLLRTTEGSVEIMIKQVERLNLQTSDMVRYLKETAENTRRNVEATKQLSGNLFPTI
jgi:hypothetical protein